MRRKKTGERYIRLLEVSPGDLRTARGCIIYGVSGQQDSRSYGYWQSLATANIMVLHNYL